MTKMELPQIKGIMFLKCDNEKQICSSKICEFQKKICHLEPKINLHKNISLSQKKKICDWNTVDGDIQTLQFWPRNFLVHLSVELYILIELTRKWVQGSEKQRGYTRNSAKSGGVRIKYEASKELNCKRVMSQKIYMTENNFFFLATTKSKSKEKSKRY